MECFRLKNVRQFLSSSSGLIGYFLVGVSFAWTSVALVKLSDENSTPIPINDSDSSNIASIYVFGIIFGPIVYTFFVDLLGRKWLMLIGLILHIIQWIVLYFGYEVYHIFIARIILGFAMTFTVSVLPTYMGEIAEAGNRSVLGIFIALQVPLGSIFTYSLGPYVSYYNLSLINLSIPIIALVFWLFMIESPYYLMRQNRIAEAQKSLMWLRGINNEKMVEAEMKVIQQFVSESPKRPFMQILKEVGNPVNKKAFVIILLLVAGSQYNGSTGVRAYFHLIVIDTGTDLDVNLSVIILEAIAFAVLLTSFFLINRVGRKPLFLLSCVGCIIGTFTCSLYFLLNSLGVIDNDYAIMALIGILCTQVFNAFGASSVPAIYASEMSTASLRSFFGSLFSVSAGVFAALNMKLFEVIKTNAGIEYGFLLYTLVTIVIGIVLVYVMPETKGKTLQEIQDMLAGKAGKPINESF